MARVVLIVVGMCVTLALAFNTPLPPNPKACHTFTSMCQINDRVRAYEDSWARKGVRVRSGITHAHFKSSIADYRGLMTQEPIPANTVFVSVPLDFTVMVSKCDATPDPRVVSDRVWNLWPLHTKLAVKLLLERAKGEQSNLKPFIDVLPLPQELLMPVCWPADVLEGLEYAHMEQSIDRQREEIRALYARIAEKATAVPFSEEELLWASQMVLSRAFGGDFGGSLTQLIAQVLCTVGLMTTVAVQEHVIYVTEPVQSILQDSQWLTPVLAALVSVLTVPVNILKAILASARASQRFSPFEIVRYAFDELLKSPTQMVLLPVIDSMNHVTSSPSLMRFSLNRFEVSLRRDIPTDNQIFISYGQKSNDQLFQYFGFVEEDNPADRWVFTEEFVQWLRMNPVAEARVTRFRDLIRTFNAPFKDEDMRKEKIRPLQDIVIKRSGEFRYDKQVAYLRYLTATQKDLSTVDAEDVMKRMSLPLSEESERALRAAVADMAHTALTRVQDRQRTLVDSRGKYEMLLREFYTEKERILLEAVSVWGSPSIMDVT